MRTPSLDDYREVYRENLDFFAHFTGKKKARSFRKGTEVSRACAMACAAADYEQGEMGSTARFPKDAAMYLLEKHGLEYSRCHINRLLRIGRLPHEVLDYAVECNVADRQDILEAVSRGVTPHLQPLDLAVYKTAIDAEKERRISKRLRERGAQKQVQEQPVQLDLPLQRETSAPVAVSTSVAKIRDTEPCAEHTGLAAKGEMREAIDVVKKYTGDLTKYPILVAALIREIAALTEELRKFNAGSHCTPAVPGTSAVPAILPLPRMDIPLGKPLPLDFELDTWNSIEEWNELACLARKDRFLAGCLKKWDVYQREIFGLVSQVRVPNRDMQDSHLEYKYRGGPFACAWPYLAGYKSKLAAKSTEVSKAKIVAEVLLAVPKFPIEHLLAACYPSCHLPLVNRGIGQGHVG